LALSGGLPEAGCDVVPDGLTPLQHVSWLELCGYMRNVLLRDSDVFSMAHHLELRVPFVDREVAAASTEVADELKVRNGRCKAVLVDAVRDLLPTHVWERPKQGFTLPFDAWMRGPLAPLVRGALCDGSRVERVGLNPTAVRDVWRAYEQRGSVSWSRPWALFTLVRWAEQLGASVSSRPVTASVVMPLAVS
jgi:asparagine synthase (glutamine-hydrolysing)